MKTVKEYRQQEMTLPAGFMLVTATQQRTWGYWAGNKLDIKENGLVFTDLGGADSYRNSLRGHPQFHDLKFHIVHADSGRVVQ